MNPLFETIAVIQSKVQNIEYHQSRYERSLRQFYGKSAVNIFDLFQAIHLPKDLLNQFVRCRIEYDRHNINVQYFPFIPKNYRTFQPVVCDHIDYGLKYTDRYLLNQLLQKRQNCDEIIIIKQGKVTDCSIGNLVFRKDNQWFTPDTPLLKGTQREKLLQQNIIQECEILAQDINKFDEIVLINALNPFRTVSPLP
ncbi:aminotransferase class IV family protein [Rodentibacter caecimuris]|uniref:Branched-chain amino acid aminotransferase n=1 Tax=Rodentibacter caecimuris TaxID=1796644 RepID=A0ABX3KWA4_9PAST|nr:hypothetical protein BKG89_09410 [Rodentibacter heylii]